MWRRMGPTGMGGAAGWSAMVGSQGQAQERKTQAMRIAYNRFGRAIRTYAYNWCAVRAAGHGRKTPGNSLVKKSKMHHNPQLESN